MLSQLIRRFGRIDVALAAWNAGPGTVARHGGGMPPIAETQAHVHLVLELYWALLQNSMPRGAKELQMHGATGCVGPELIEPSRMTMTTETPDNGDAITLAHYAERAYLEYALSVVKGRALPDVCDGQKPVQRRILFAMERLGLSFTGASRRQADEERAHGG